jgi:hypothetical protein
MIMNSKTTNFRLNLIEAEEQPFVIGTKYEFSLDLSYRPTINYQAPMENLPDKTNVALRIPRWAKSPDFVLLKVRLPAAVRSLINIAKQENTR